jgi:dedicator of cytokinesis protein 3
VDLVSLLKWKSHPEKIKQTLENMAHVSGEETVKFLQDVLDSLFAMFLSEIGESCEYSGDVFIVLVNICVLLEDGKFEHFKPVIDAYITDHFAAALVYK